MSATASGDAAALGRAIEALGLACRVEARDRLAVLRLDVRDVERLTDPELRSRLVALLPAYGFTHVALELRDADDGTGR